MEGVLIKQHKLKENLLDNTKEIDATYQTDSLVCVNPEILTCLQRL